MGDVRDEVKGSTKRGEHTVTVYCSDLCLLDAPATEGEGWV